MQGLNVWAKLGIGATALWVMGFSLASYFNLAASVAEERRLGKLMCPSGDANCLAANVSHWINASKVVLAGYAVAEAILVAAVAWTVVALGFAVLAWVAEEREPMSAMA